MSATGTERTGWRHQQVAELPGIARVSLDQLAVDDDRRADACAHIGEDEAAQVSLAAKKLLDQCHRPDLMLDKHLIAARRPQLSGEWHVMPAKMGG